LACFHEQWQPKVIAEMNDYQFKVVKLQGDFIWHHHRDTDETFIVIEGDLRIDFRNGAVDVRAGEMCRSEGGGAQTVRRERGQVAPD
jgi:mannose-6-phosphate isomerase-like protein (cupin superfamily)